VLSYLVIDLGLILYIIMKSRNYYFVYYEIIKLLCSVDNEPTLLLLAYSYSGNTTASFVT